MLRPLFLKEAKLIKPIKIVDSAFVCFGGADPFDLTLKAAQALLNISNIQKVYIVLGGAYAHKDIFELIKIHPHKLKIYQNLSEESLLQTIQKCDFAIVPSSNILYEVCCVKMPILSGYYVDNQKLIYKGLVDKNVIFEGGDFSDYKVLDFEDKINFVLGNPNIKIHLENQGDLFDGKIKNRLLGLINELNISFRKCNEDDMLMVFNWSNDELVRKNSYDTKPLLIENHEIWFSNKIMDENSLFLIALVNDVPAGIVRYEIASKHSIVGLLISEEFRGQGLASKFLIQSSKLYFKNWNVPILAYIKKENLASVNAFVKARYCHLKDDIIKESSSFVYKLEKKNVKE